MSSTQDGSEETDQRALSAAKIEGRSSFGRLGLSVHCSTDFANPGYRGNFPLLLFNHSPTAIRLFPFIPICQWMLIPLSSLPTRRYGASVLQSKYMDDDGGPSYWWRDKRIRTLQETLAKGQIDVTLQEELLSRIGIQEPEVIERFERFLTKRRNAELGSSPQALRAFAEAEERLRKRHRVTKGVWIVVLYGSRIGWWQFYHVQAVRRVALRCVGCYPALCVAV